MEYDFWRKQEAGKPLFPDIEWSKPERRDQAGKLLIVGGNKLGFSAVAEAYQTALSAGVGQVKVLLPDCLKGTVPSTLLDVVFAACTPSGSLSKDAISELKVAGQWSDAVLLIGDAGRNAETALVYEEFIRQYTDQLTITRDAVDLIKNDPTLIADRPNTLVVASFAQAQKLFGGVYYPKVLTFNMQLLQLVEALHKFTITYPVSILTLHKDSLIIAAGGEVVTQKWDEPMAIWRGSVATHASAYWMWHPKSALEASSASVYDAQ
jgi:NAD(P)H-hydrate repair Nnr-like enzyme with NAD(P)H-hydrate dehydratase domain